MPADQHPVHRLRIRDSDLHLIRGLAVHMENMVSMGYFAGYPYASQLVIHNQGD